MLALFHPRLHLCRLPIAKFNVREGNNKLTNFVVASLLKNLINQIKIFWCLLEPSLPHCQRDLSLFQRTHPKFPWPKIKIPLEKECNETFGK